MIGNRTSGAWRASGADAVLTAIVVAVAIAGCPGAGLPGAFGQCQYEPFVLEGPECQWPFPGNANLTGRGLNEHGHIAGWWTHCGSDVDEAFYWTPEMGIVTLPRPEGVYGAMAHDINDEGIVIGIHWVMGSGALGFAFDPDTQEFQYLPPLHEGAMATFTSSANAINNSGIVAGSRIIGKPGQSPMPFNAVIWDTNTGEVIDLGIPPGTPNSTARAITNNSHVVGTVGSPLPQEGWVNNDSGILPLGVIPGGTTSSAFGVNESRKVAGGGWLRANKTGLLTQGAIWRNSRWELLPHLEGANSGGPVGVNNVNQFVGSEGFSGGGEVGALWQHGTVYDLNTLTPEITGMTSARAINNHGQILLRLGNTRAVLLTPKTVPFADLNFDCTVNEHDLLILLAAFGAQHGVVGSVGGAPHPADLNGDGIVNVADLLIMLGNWSP